MSSSPKVYYIPLQLYQLNDTKGSETNDYGKGFYCTEKSELAKEWACLSLKDGFSNKYEFDISDLKVMYLNKEGYNILNWLALLLDNRIFQKRSPISRQASEYLLEEFLPDISGYDVIWGYRADDSYFSYAKDFLNNGISVEQLSQAMKLGELGEQIVLMSPKAFEKIKFIEYEIVDGSIYNPRRMERENRARRAYLDNHGVDFEISKNDLFVRDILSGKVKYISGMSGIELARLVLKKCGKKPSSETELPYIDYPPEYWIGWILAYYQWHTAKSFSAICKKIGCIHSFYSIVRTTANRH